MKQGLYQIPGAPPDRSFHLGSQGAACRVEGWRGRSLSGRLLDFDPDQRSVTLQCDDVAEPLVLRQSQVKMLRIASRVKDALAAVLPASDSVTPRVFSVKFKDSTVFSGLATGLIKQPDGLWIFAHRPLSEEPASIYFYIPMIGVSHFEYGDDSGTEPTQLIPDVSDSVPPEPDEPDEPATGPVRARLLNAARTTREELSAALESQLQHKPMPIGEALISLGKISRGQLTEALARQTPGKAVPLGQILLHMGLVKKADLQLALVTKMGYPFVDLRQFSIDVAALRRVPAATAVKLRVLPLMEWRSNLVVAMTDPLQFKVLDELEFTSQRKVKPVVTTSTDLVARISKAYRGIGMVEAPAPNERQPRVERDVRAASEQDAWMLAAELAGGEPRSVEEEQSIEQSDNTLVRLINSMITEAYHQRASDIHIEPYPGREKVAIRFRIDGELRPYLELPPSYRKALIARIKIMCDLDISEHRKPQDGKITFAKFSGLPIELRVATIPTAHGLEDVVMRLLTGFKVVPLESLDLAPRNLQQLERLIARPYGLFLCVGPTGSGKTTTLHSALQRLNRPNRKIWTAEDPVEITQHGLRQIQVNPKIGWNFAVALRALLRADPDVIMVGEIRDAETAEIAIEASLTGHLVLSTLHTNSAAETIVRLNDLGIDSFSLADSLQGVLAQRLVRRLCPSCVQSRPMTPERLHEITEDYQSALPAGHALRDSRMLHAEWLQRHAVDGRLPEYHAAGCDHCAHTGYLGRLALHELLVGTPAVRELVQRRARSAEIRELAIAEGMLTLRQDGIDKVLAGQTSLAEVRASAND